MLKNLKCIECSSINKILYPDHRIPPLDPYPCLCSGCHISSVEEHIEVLQEDIDNFKEALLIAKQRL